jgi:hypothetical protein
MPRKKTPPGPREGDEYGYDPAARHRARIRDLFDHDMGDRGKPNQLAKAASVPKITVFQKRLIDAAVSIRQAAAEELLFAHAVLCQTCLPAKKPDDEVRRWVRQQGRALLTLEAGTAYHPKIKDYVPLGLPYGPKARLILMHLNSEAMRTGSPDIDAGASLTAFVRRVQDHDPTGPEIRMFKEQLARLSAAMVRLAITEGDRAMQIDTKVVGAFDLWFPRDENQRVLWPTTVRLSLDYFESLTRYAVPLDERAIAVLSHSALALDVYCWLAQRLHRIPQGKAQFVPWTSLQEQFGQGYGEVRFFRRDLLKLLTQVKSVYDAARFHADKKGMYLWTSPPPVAKRLLALGSDKLIDL